MGELIHKFKSINRMNTVKQDSRNSKMGDEDHQSPPPLLNVDRTISEKLVGKAMNELRVLSLEKEIIGITLSHVEKAEAEGKITKEDRAQLLEKYGTKMETLAKQINEKEAIITLYELEGTQTKLIVTFNKKLDEIYKKIENIKHLSP